MPKIRVTCTDPYATDCSSDDGDESIEGNKPNIGGLFVKEISVSLPIIFPPVCTIHFDSLAKLKLESSIRVHESESSRGRHNHVVLALPARKSEHILQKKSDISVQNTLEKLSKKNPEASLSSINLAANIPVAKKSGSLGAEKHPGINLRTSGKYGVRIRDPITRSEIWLGTYSTVEEAKRIYNKKKLEFASMKSESVMEGASLKIDEPKSFVDGSNCVVLALSARGTEDTPGKKSGNGLKKLHMAQKCQPDNPCPVSVAMTSRNLRTEQHPGLKLTKSGKFAVRIRNPITRKRIWLGTYSTIDEAKSIYIKKKIEYASSLRHSILKAKHKDKGKRKQQKVVIEGISVWETVSGKWRVSICDPVSKCHVWLDSHVTPEEAAESYHRKMLEFDSTYNRDYHRKMLEFDSLYNHHSVGEESVNDGCISAGGIAETCVPASDVSNGWIPAADVPETCVPACDSNIECSPSRSADPLVATNIADIEHPAVKLTGAGKWRVAIRHPMLKNSLSLGLYDTAEEAEKVYNRNKLELDAVLHSDKIFGSPTAVASDEGLRVKGVRTSGNGRWWSQICNPFKKRNKVYLGTFSTAEEAAEAYKRTRREFDAIVSLVKKRKREAESEAHKAGGFKSKKTAINLEEGWMLTDDRTRLFEIVVEPPSCNENSVKTLVSSQECNSSSNDTCLCDEFGMGVIDSYGRLVGEYCRLDDELWLSRPGEDEEFDANGEFFYGNGELAWDFDSKPSLST